MGAAMFMLIASPQAPSRSVDRLNPGASVQTRSEWPCHLGLLAATMIRICNRSLAAAVRATVVMASRLASFWTPAPRLEPHILAHLSREGH